MNEMRHNGEFHPINDMAELIEMTKREVAQERNDPAAQAVSKANYEILKDGIGEKSGKASKEEKEGSFFSKAFNLDNMRDNYEKKGILGVLKNGNRETDADGNRIPLTQRLQDFIQNELPGIIEERMGAALSPEELATARAERMGISSKGPEIDEQTRIANITKQLGCDRTPMDIMGDGSVAVLQEVCTRTIQKDFAPSSPAAAQQACIG
jgi:hypothetical protein